jgi:C-terminal processing protease CtpA/Prc
MKAARSARLYLSVAVLLVLVLGALPAHAAEPAAGSSLDRLTQVGHLWGTVRYLHPYLLYRDIDWDAALVAALPRVEAAKSPQEYAAAVQGMLAALGDPVTRVLPAADTDAVSPLKPLEGQAPPALTRRLDDGTLVLDLTAAVRSMGSRDLMMSISPAFAETVQQRAVIVDLRGPAGEGDSGEILSYLVGELGGSLVSRPCRAPSQRFVQRSGYRPQEGTTSGGYYEGFVTTSAESFAPPDGLPAVERRVVFLVSRTGSLPAVALALQAAGDARIVAEGPLGEEAVVTTKMIPLDERLNVRMRVSEMLPMAGWQGVHADVEMPEVSDVKSGGDAALEAARAELKKDGWGKPAAASSSSSAASAAVLPEAVFRPDPTYPEMLAPDLPHRRLAVIRAWNVIHFFYPYLHLIGDWDAVLPEFLAKMEKAETGKDYALTIDEMMAHVPDGHTSLYGHPGTRDYYGAARLPLAVRWIEEAAVITAVSGDEAKAAGLLPGDAIAAVDGEPVAARIERLSRFVPASTRAAQIDRICGLYLLRGPAGPAVLSIQGLDGKTREVRLTREKNSRVTLPPAGDTVRILPGNLGYVDLTRLTVPEVDALFEKIKDTRALILDMRGYPQGTAWSIAPRLNTNHARLGAQFRRSLLSALSDEEDGAGVYFSQPLPLLPPGKALYTHPTVMLIDDRAISQSEHSGLFYEAANGTKFIGTPSAGANGDVTGFTLPGGIHVNFTGHDVRHADGRQLQRVGLQPDVVIAPTRAGIREGKDEVLERAVRFLDEAAMVSSCLGCRSHVQTTKNESSDAEDDPD